MFRSRLGLSSQKTEGAGARWVAVRDRALEDDINDRREGAVERRIASDQTLRRGAEKGEAGDERRLWLLRSARRRR